MLNLRQLTRPSPNDANLHTVINPLGMLSRSDYAINHNPYFHNTHKRLSNRTNDIFNHIREPNGGYDGGGVRLSDVLTSNRKGGTVGFTQWYSTGKKCFNSTIGNTKSKRID